MEMHYWPFLATAFPWWSHSLVGSTAFRMKQGSPSDISQLDIFPFRPSVLASLELSLEACHGQYVPGAAESCTICTGVRDAGENDIKSTSTLSPSSLVHPKKLV